MNPTKLFSFAVLCFCLFGFSFSFAQTTGIVSTGSLVTGNALQSTATTDLSQYTSIKNQFTTLDKEITQFSLTGTYGDMFSLLNCMGISVPTNDVTYNELYLKLKNDFDLDFINFNGNLTQGNMIRLNLYKQSLISLSDALAKDRAVRQTIMQGLVTKNQSLFNQLSADKKILDELLSVYSNRSQMSLEHKALYGYTAYQYSSIIENYTTNIIQAFIKNITSVQSSYNKRNKDINAFSGFSIQQKQYIIDNFANDLSAYFSQLSDGNFNTKTLSRFKDAIDTVQQSYYSGSRLQCGLLTAINSQQRNYYTSLISEIKGNISQNQWSGVMNSGTVSLFVSGSDTLKELNDWNSKTTTYYLNDYKGDLLSQLSLWKKAVAFEKSELTSLGLLFNQYKQSEGTSKMEFKNTIVYKIKSLEKDMISVRNKKLLERIKKSI